MSNLPDKEFYRVIHRAYLRENGRVHTGEALLLACLMHTKGKNRASDDFKDVQRIMGDRNVDKTTEKGKR